MSRKDRVPALLVTSVLNGLFVWWIASFAPPLTMPPAAAPDAIDIVWLARTPAAPSESPIADRSRNASPAREHKPQARSDRSSTAARIVNPHPAMRIETIEGSDAWAPAGTTAMPPPAAGNRFRHRALPGPVPGLVAVKPRVTFVMREGSGLAARCAQLRRMLGSESQLAANATNREVVARSMHEDGCFR